MLSSAECRQRAEQKIADADLNARRRKKLRADAECWLVLADRMEQLESSLRAAEQMWSEAGKRCQDVSRTDRKISIIEQFRLAAGPVCSHAKEQPVGCSSGASRWP
jgi:hypothetical protein